MKKFQIMLLFILLLLQGYSQDTLPPTRPHAVGSITLAITSGFTTNLVFPYGIATVDIGSRDILVRKSGAAENVLLLKAAKRDFSPTNLSIYTKDGKLYSYWLRYADTLKVYNYSYAQEQGPEARPFLHRQVQVDDLKIRLTGIYSRDGLLWLVFNMTNHSSLDYFLGTVRFSIRDKKHTRKMVLQEENWEPLYAAAPSFLAGGSGDRLRYGFTAIAPGKKKEIVAEWADEQGDRRIRLVIPAKLLLKAQRQ